MNCSDGVYNYLSALRVASDEGCDKGVLVVENDETTLSTQNTYYQCQHLPDSTTAIGLIMKHETLL